MAQALEPKEREAAQERQATAGPTTGRGAKMTGVEKFTEAVKGRVRDKVAAAVGMSRPTLPGWIPVLAVSGLPDLEVMRHDGRTAQAEEYERRVNVVARVRARLDRRAEPKGQVYARVAAVAGVSVRTLRRWDSELKKHGWAGLMPSWGHQRGKHPALPRPLQKAILDRFCQAPGWSAALVHEHVVKRWCRDHDVGAVPSLRTIQRFLDKSVPPVVETASREGIRAYQTKHEPKVYRDLSTLGVNSWWASDFRLADTLVYVSDARGTGWGNAKGRPCPCGSGRERRRCCSAKRLWWCATFDVGSAMPVGFRLCVRPNAATVCHTLHEAVMGFGAPANWQRDNGKELGVARLDGIEAHLDTPRASDVRGCNRWPAFLGTAVEGSTMWQMLGCQVHTTTPYAPWAKLPEALFSSLARRIELLLPGYVGGNPDRRPGHLARELREGAILSADGYAHFLRETLADWSTRKPIGKQRDRTPAAYYLHHEPRHVDPQALAFLLRDQTELTVRQGRLHLRGRDYSSEELARYSGCKGWAHFDPGRPGWLYFYPQGANTCLAVAERPLGTYGEFGDVAERVRREQRALRGYTKQWALSVKGGCPRVMMDPTGAHAHVHEQAQAVKSQARQERKDLKRIADLAQGEVDAKRQAEKDAAEERRAPGHTVYWDHLKDLA